MGKKIDRNLLAKAVNKYKKGNTTLREVGVEFGISHETVRKNLGNKDLPNVNELEMSKKIGLPKNHNKKWSADEIDVLIDLVDLGNSDSEIGNILGRTPNAVAYYRWLTNNGMVRKSISATDKETDMDPYDFDSYANSDDSCKCSKSQYGLEELAEIVVKYDVVITIINGEITIKR